MNDYSVSIWSACNLFAESLDVVTQDRALASESALKGDEL